MTPDFTIIGAGIFGLTTAIELRQQGHSVKVINPTQGPDPAAASYDISKIIRMEYGSDRFYMEAADKCIDIWHDWNIEFGRPLYHEVGFALLCRKPMEDPLQHFELASFQNLIECGHKPERIDSKAIADRFPVFNSALYVDGFYHARAGYAEATTTLQFLRERAIRIGIEMADGLRVESLVTDDSTVSGIKCRNGSQLKIGQLIICAGAFTASLIDMGSLLISTGHPVFHFEPGAPESFQAGSFPVFGADISNTGWYGFPLHPTANVVKVANHSAGLATAPFEAYRALEDAEVDRARDFVRSSIPTLANESIVYTRRCFYSDTFDGHFLIDKHPHFKNVTIGTGGSGHGFKMGPLLGKWIAKSAIGDQPSVPSRFHWREPIAGISNQEEARNASAK